jgi:putative glutamine amidotransferase
MRNLAYFTFDNVLRKEEFDRILENPPTDHIWLAPGGADIDPTLYGEENNGLTQICHPDIDHKEFLLIRRLLELRIPLLAICRGHQLVTAAAGGTLIQDITAETGNPHHHYEVAVDTTSKLFSILAHQPSNTLHVNSMHHQATGNMPLGWKIVATAPDGIIEAIEHPDLPVVSVQWHPEMLRYQLDPIFDYLSQFVR